MAKEPWEEKIVDDTIGTRTRKSRNAFISTPWLTALLSVFFVIIVAILFIFFYTSNSGSNRQAETNGFYGASTHKKTRKASNAKKTSSSSTTTDTTPSSEETLASSEVTGETLTVLAGEGAASIAARAGISVEQLQALNPEHMTQGYWYANPGDQVTIK
ncbi:TPA: LysM peptidoglycan-binding domain-containing protein [Streptococcus pyogenes]|uniref:SAG1386/EF1546 family surface-associated protein n=1 Tax=Streptococcus pyogenes TaxID=1314 RepID=UPI000640AEDD|nr:SAG1386/EF1546 family surface-associated protein [Streptococcus pyogenes]HER4514790.1 LysM peptidoglycan-binding domain-containing protein [Streptococcus pyogenes NGAS743]HER4523786.1 LysM peptidoglycan-binding domain-containing protein [Streptococcus pyogenes NGAS747]HER4526963.1 LysM peptidoglycan-binding domain-containing protein [Streptococcus pyogenes NGAS739]HER4538490.1 LysM peptidoglycan-binding domain-containing protein [Streptococcus pyogenes NGAS668]HER4541907.1 LysM peptidoglyca